MNLSWRYKPVAYDYRMRPAYNAMTNSFKFILVILLQRKVHPENV